MNWHLIVKWVAGGGYTIFNIWRVMQVLKRREPGDPR